MINKKILKYINKDIFKVYTIIGIENDTQISLDSNYNTYFNNNIIHSSHLYKLNDIRKKKLNQLSLCSR